ncbi:hypothetical protein ACS0TY_015965 [Phlomoides rotata]
METTAETSAAAEGVVGVEQRLLMAEVKKMKVMVPMDESEGSFYALRWAIDHLFNTAAAVEPPVQVEVSVILVNVQSIFQPFIYPAGPVVYATPSVIEAVTKSQEENAANILSRAMHVCKEKKIKAETLILHGDPKDKICQAAEELHVGLVVLGSRGLGPIKRALLGSVSNYCTHHIHCPVLIVKPPLKPAHD